MNATISRITSIRAPNRSGVKGRIVMFSFLCLAVGSQASLPQACEIVGMSTAAYQLIKNERMTHVWIIGAQREATCRLYQRPHFRILPH